MKTTNFGKLNVEVSQLGFGCMRFPMDENGKINEVKSQELIDYAIANGVNYLDTAYIYHDGESEKFLGKAIKKHDRSKLYLADKMPMWLINSLDQAKEIFEDEFARLDVEYIDFYLVHSLSKETWQRTLDLKIIDFLEEQKSLGKIKHLGFSFHDDYEVFEEIINYKDWDFCQIQLNYVDELHQAGLKGYELATKLNIPVIIMEPTKGGALSKISGDLLEEINKHNISPSNLAFRYFAKFDNAQLILSGMTEMDHVVENCEIFSTYAPLTDAENKLIDYLKQQFNTRVKNGCTRCNYCMPCPAGVNIPQCFHVWNNYGKYQDLGAFKFGYFQNLKPENRADQCIECGQCLEKCPQAIEIIEDLKKLATEADELNK